MATRLFRPGAVFRCGVAAALVGEKLWSRLQNAPSSYSTSEGWIFHPHEVEDSPPSSPLARGQAVQVNAIIFLGRSAMADGGAEVLPLQCINAARSALPKIAPLVDRAPVYSLKRGSLLQMIASVEALRLEASRLESARDIL